MREKNTDLENTFMVCYRNESLFHLWNQVAQVEQQGDKFTLTLGFVDPTWLDGSNKIEAFNQDHLGKKLEYLGLDLTSICEELAQLDPRYNKDAIHFYDILDDTSMWYEAGLKKAKIKITMKEDPIETYHHLSSRLERDDKRILELAELCYDAKDIQTAFEYLKRAEKSVILEEQAHYLSAQLYAKQGDIINALSQSDQIKDEKIRNRSFKLIDIFATGDQRNYFLKLRGTPIDIIRINIHQGNISNALNLIDQIRRDDPSTEDTDEWVDSQILKGSLMEEMNMKNLAIQVYQEVLNREDNPYFCTWLERHIINLLRDPCE